MGGNDKGQLADGTINSKRIPVRSRFFGYLKLSNTAYSASGTFVSDSIDMTEMIHTNTLDFTAYTPPSTEIKFQLSANNDNSTWNFVGPDGTDSTYFTSSSTEMPESFDTKRYFKYKVFLTTSDETISPALNDITLKYYPTETIVSSVYNSSDVANIAAAFKVVANEDGGALTNSTVYAQVRAGSDNNPTGENWTDWCGPNTCDGEDYFNFTNSNLNTFVSFEAGNPMLDGTDTQYLQYKLILGTTDGLVSPIITGTAVQYVVNAIPQISNVTASQGADGIITITYNFSDGDNSSGAISFLADTEATLNEELDSSDTTITLSDTTNLASSGTIQINEEQISYTNKNGNDLTGVTRRVNNSNASMHSTGELIWFKGSVVSGDVGTGVATGEDKSGTWNIKSDLDGKYLPTSKIKITANDGEGANQSHSADSGELLIDIANPIISNLTLDASSNPAKINILSADDSVYQMRISQGADLSSCQANLVDINYETYNISPTINLNEVDPSTICIQLKDEYGNQSPNPPSSSASSPETPIAMMIQDTTNVQVSPNEFRLFAAWKMSNDSDFNRYELYRSTDNITFNQIFSTFTKSTNSYPDNNVIGDQLYYYKVKTIDLNSNQSYYSQTISANANGIQDYGEGGGGTSTAPPIIDNVQVQADKIYTSQVTITWNTDVPSNSTVGYSNTECLVSPCSFTTEVGSDTMYDFNDTNHYGPHTVVLTNLTPDTATTSKSNPPVPVESLLLMITKIMTISATISKPSPDQKLSQTLSLSLR